MTTEGVDYSYRRPGGAALAKAGKWFAVRYITGDTTKPIDSAEIKDLRAHGIAIALVFETTRGRAVKGGVAGGAADARSAVSRMAAERIPATLPVYFAVDFDPAALAQQRFEAGQAPSVAAALAGIYAAIDDYLRGAASVIGLARTGVYGGIAIVNHCRAAGTAHWFWQTAAWSDGKVASSIHLYQYSNSHTINGAPVDFDRALQPNYGQWAADDSLPDSSTGGTVSELGVTFTAPIPFVTNGSVESYDDTPPHAHIGPLNGKVSVIGTLAIDTTTTPHGDFVVIATGTAGRRIIAAALVTPLVTDCTQAVSDARAAQHEVDRTAAIAAAGTI